MWILHCRFNTERILNRFEKFWRPALIRSRELLHQRSNEIDGSTLMLNENEQFTRRKSASSTINILKPLLRTYWPDMVYLAVLKLISSLLIFVGPIVLDYLITFINSDEPTWRGLFYASLLFLSAFVDSMLSNQYEFGVSCLGMKVKSSLVSTVYKKALRLSSAGRSSYTTGQIVNIMAVDTMYIYNYVNTYNLLWSCPLQIIICLRMIWTQLGIASLAGYGVIVFMVPVNGFITMKIKRYQTEMMKCNASRLKLMNQLLNGIKVLKLYAWERSFNDRIAAVREQEVHYLKKTGYYLAGITFAFTCTPFFIAAASFAMFVLMDPANVLTPTKAFVSLSLFNLLTIPLAILPMTITFAVLFAVSLRRVNKFLEADELDLKQVQRNPYIQNGSTASDDAVLIDNASFTWSRHQEAPFKNVSLRVGRNKLIAVVGQVGAGKSSLFSALLGEMHKTSGKVVINGAVSYVPQEAWIQNATLKDNILFGNEFDQTRYEKVLSVCALKPDFEMLDAGDQTEIGEKGINLSGGQKQRVSLARACYAKADIYLMDDPLSAVDTHVGKHLFEKVIGPDGYLRNKTRILITHKATLFPLVDEIVVMKNCEISERGSYNELLEQKGAFAEIMTQYVATIEHEGADKDDAQILESIKKRIDLTSLSNELTSSKSRSLAVKSTSIDEHCLSEQKKKMIKKVTSGGRLTTDEKEAIGKVKWSVYTQYLGVVSLKLLSFTMAGFFVFSGLSIARSLWLSDWSNDALDPAKSVDTRLRDKRLLVYTGLGLSETVFILMTAISLNLAFVKASRHVHLSMLKRLVLAPLTFFDTTPIGRVLNRFSEDLNITDVTLRINFRMFLVLGFRTLTSFIIMGFSTPIFFLALIPLAFIYNFIQVQIDCFILFAASFTTRLF
jgi:ATP-binding cassette subfamily C (CFTR/MRP) protein 1